jgi:hypothetical protein
MSKKTQEPERPRYRRKCQPVREVPEPRDWSKLFDGSVYLLEKGIDYEGSCDLYALIVQDKGGRLGYVVRTEITPEGIVVQAIKG